jgi:hypothetical protein
MRDGPAQVGGRPRMLSISSCEISTLSHEYVIGTKPGFTRKNICAILLEVQRLVSF